MQYNVHHKQASVFCSSVLCLLCENRHYSDARMSKVVHYITGTVQDCLMNQTVHGRWHKIMASTSVDNMQNQKGIQEERKLMVSTLTYQMMTFPYRNQNECNTGINIIPCIINIYRILLYHHSCVPSVICHESMSESSAGTYMNTRNIMKMGTSNFLHGGITVRIANR
jgi:hypothetical protein